MPKAIQQVRVGRSEVSFGGKNLGFTRGEITLTYSPEYRLFVPDQLSAANKAFFIVEGLKVEIPLAQSTAESMADAKTMAQGIVQGAAPAGSPGNTTLDGAHAAGVASIEVALITNFDDGDKIIVGTGVNSEVAVIAGTPSGTTIALAFGLQFDHADLEAVKEVDGAKLKFSVGGLVTEPATAALLIDPVDGSDDIAVYRAFVMDEVELSLTKEEEVVIGVTYTALLDTTRTAGDQLYSVGDQTV